MDDGIDAIMNGKRGCTGHFMGKMSQLSHDQLLALRQLASLLRKLRFARHNVGEFPT
jgi:hypothetical protein